MYTLKNFRTKKALKDAHARGEVIAFQREVFPGSLNGYVVVQGPHFPEPHRWAARVLLENGVIKPGSKIE